MSKDSNPMIGRRQVLVGGLLAGMSAATLARMPVASQDRLRKGEIDKLVPRTIADWTYATSNGVVLPPPDSLSDRLYDNVSTSLYTSETRPAVMLLLAYSAVQDGMLQLHRPEFCYSASGYQLSPTNNLNLVNSTGKPIGGNSFEAASSGMVETVVYFTRIGHTFPQSWIEQRTSVLRANLNRVVPDGLLVRVSVAGLSRAEAMETLSGFLTEFDRVSPPKLKTILFG